jgi:hypothetical protein
MGAPTRSASRTRDPDTNPTSSPRCRLDHVFGLYRDKCVIHATANDLARPRAKATRRVSVVSVSDRAPRSRLPSVDANAKALRGRKSAPFWCAVGTRAPTTPDSQRRTPFEGQRAGVAFIRCRGIVSQAQVRLIWPRRPNESDHSRFPPIGAFRPPAPHAAISTCHLHAPPRRVNLPRRPSQSGSVDAETRHYIAP